jgi:hypothetical protein
MDILKDESLYTTKLTFTKGSVPLKHHEENIEENRHYVVRIVPKTDDARINLSVFDTMRPLVLPAHKRTTLIGNMMGEYIYLVELTGDFEEVKLDIKLSFGNIQFSYGSSLDELVNAESTHMTVPSSKDVKYRPKGGRNQDITLFNEFYIKVNSSDFSKFSILVRGTERFREMRDFETEIVYTLPNEEQFLYYHMTASKVKKYKSMVIDIYAVHSYGNKPSFYYNPDDDDDEIDLDNEKKLLPMPRRDYQVKTTAEFKHFEMTPEVKKGYYIIKVPRSKHRVPLKIALGLHHERSIEVNGVYRSELPKENIPAHKYTMYLPQAGEFRFLVESCERASIKEALLKIYMNDSPVTFAENLVESETFLVVDSTDPNKVRGVKKNFINHVFRGNNDAPGVLEFKVERSDKRTYKDTKDLVVDNREYLLVSEFKPNNKDLFFKDYVNIFPNFDDFRNKYKYEWINQSTSLKIQLPVPHFREQLLLDYPNLQKIVIKFFLYLFDDADFENKLTLCGLTALDIIEHERRFRPLSLKVPDDINNDDSISFSITQKEIQKFSESANLQIFSYVSISFFETELEEFEINLDMKFTNLPYVHFILPNQSNRKSFSFAQLFLFLVGFAFVLLLLMFVCKTSSNSDLPGILESARQSYSQPDDIQMSGRNKIQMTKL